MALLDWQEVIGPGEVVAIITSEGREKGQYVRERVSLQYYFVAQFLALNSIGLELGQVALDGRLYRNEKLHLKMVVKLQPIHLDRPHRRTFTTIRVSATIGLGLQQSVFKAIGGDLRGSKSTYYRAYQAAMWLSLRGAVLSLFFLPFLTLGTQGNTSDEDDDAEKREEPQLNSEMMK